MDVNEPHARRRGFFLHSDTGDPDAGELENPEGFIVRVRIHRSSVLRQVASAASRVVSGTRFSSGRQSRSQALATPADESRPALRSESVTGSRQQAHLPR